MACRDPLSGCRRDQAPIERRSIMATARSVRVMVLLCPLLAALACDAGSRSGGAGVSPDAGAGRGPAPGRADGGASAGVPGGFVEKPCNFTRASARPVTCGVVPVPEARGGSSTRTVELAVVIIKSASPTPAADPLLFLQGGPGGG